MDHGHVLAQKDYVHCNQEINVDTPLSGTLWHHNNYRQDNQPWQGKLLDATLVGYGILLLSDGIRSVIQ